jgi:acetyl coenzyme A synthetase (ADP forming)-like protein
MSTPPSPLHRLLRPRSIAIVGVSRHPRGIGRRVLEALVSNRFPGEIYAINPAGGDIDGRPLLAGCRDLPAPVDLAVIAVPADRVLDAARDAIGAKVGGLLVISAGFAEIGADGAARERELAAMVEAAGIRMIGPNCLGLVNAPAGVNASFSPTMPPAGHIALSSQSGALGLTILELARQRGLGLSTFVSVGNKANVSSNDLLEYWEHDDDTRVITLYVESFGNPRRFAELARRIGREKPIIAVKAGRTRAGSRAASSHTAALAATDTVVDGLFAAAGVIRADTIDELFDVAALVADQPLPAGRRVAVVTNAGGPGILAVDACERAGLQVAPFSAALSAELGGCLPSTASVVNPVDMIASADADAYRRVVRAVMQSGEADAVLIIYTPVDRADRDATVAGIRDGIREAREAGATLPVLGCLMAERGVAPLGVGDERVPVYLFPENAARALARTCAYAEWRRTAHPAAIRPDDIDRGTARDVVEAALAGGRGWLRPDETARLLRAYGITLTPTVAARTAGEAVARSAAIGFPVAAKLTATGLVHKSDVDGVRLNLGRASDVRDAFEGLTRVAATLGFTDAGVLLQPMAPRGVELMVGATHDPLFGAVVGFGRGGTDVELERDMQFRIAPLSGREAEMLMRESRAWPLIEGFRGRPPADARALAEVIERVAWLASDFPEVAELDLNPLIAAPAGHGVAIVDARVRVAPWPQATA